MGGANAKTWARGLEKVPFFGQGFQVGEELTGFDSSADPAKLPAAPPGAPDLNDDMVRRARAAERQKQLGQQGRASTFLTGPGGDSAQVPTAPKTLLGG